MTITVSLTLAILFDSNIKQSLYLSILPAEALMYSYIKNAVPFEMDCVTDSHIEFEYVLIAFKIQTSKSLSSQNKQIKSKIVGVLNVIVYFLFGSLNYGHQRTMDDIESILRTKTIIRITRKSGCNRFGRLDL